MIASYRPNFEPNVLKFTHAAYAYVPKKNITMQVAGLAIDVPLPWPEKVTNGIPEPTDFVINVRYFTSQTAANAWQTDASQRPDYDNFVRGATILWLREITPLAV